MSKEQGSPRKKTAARAYSSPARDQQADETRTRIVAAARKLFLEHGFDGTTMDAVAREAGVATPTVYAAFRSKRGLVAELLNRARMGPSYTELVKAAHAETDPEAKVLATAAIAREVFDAERSVMDILRGAGVVSPEFGDEDRERNRYTGQKRLVDYLVETGRLRPELDAGTARDVLYAMTSRDFYRQLVVVRGWPSTKYQTWLAETLVEALMTP
ncbi:MAG: transcriptional regulator, TetR family [Labilithrix sp.]|nr:transcriptional regulator, TetR family [Labilithrix sp.]